MANGRGMSFTVLPRQGRSLSPRTGTGSRGVVFTPSTATGPARLTIGLPGGNGGFGLPGFPNLPALPGGGGGGTGVGQTLSTVCRQLGVPESICLLGDVAIQNFLGQRSSGGTTLQPSNCPDGFEFDVATQTCRKTGVAGTIQRTLPGGATGVMPVGQATIGSFGIPAVFPMVAGNISRKDGTTGPILRCPSKMVLGSDDLCYQKPLPRRFRKWKPDRKPPITAQDAQAIRRANSAKNRVKKLAGDVGFSCRKK